MRCDVCYTIIPPGSNECPKCGYKYRKATGIHSSTMDFDGILEEKPYPIFDHISARVRKQPISEKKISSIDVAVFFVIIYFIAYFFIFFI